MEFTTLDQKEYMQYIGVTNHASICYLVKMWNENAFSELEDDAYHFIQEHKNEFYELDKTNRNTFKYGHTNNTILAVRPGVR